MSSFRPGDSAKLYASPESVMSSVGYRSTSGQTSGQTSAAHRSQSVPPPRNRKDPSAAYKMQVTAGTLSIFLPVKYDSILLEPFQPFRKPNVSKRPRLQYFLGEEEP